MFGLIDLTLCWEQCSGDEIDDGKTCRIPEQSHFRKSYGRGVGKPLQCADDEEQQLLTCYPKCRDGFVSKGGQGCYANPQTCGTTPTKEPSTFSHLGCYKDTGDRAMDHLENGINSIEECRDLCKENGYSLFGLQYPPNGECFCGNDKDEAMQFGEATNCEGGRGGSWSLDIYEMNDGDDEGDLIGTWDWCHDGLNRNGDITIEDDGTVSSSRVDWTGQK